MHELGVTFHIMDHLEKVAKENEVEKIRKVVLELGEVSMVIESYLQNCWTWAAKKRPLFEEAELIVETLPAITYCEDVRRPIRPQNMERSVRTVAVNTRICCREVNLTLRK